MRQPPRVVPRRIAFLVVTVVGSLAPACAAQAQNDWQFPDPYFGAAVAGRRPATAIDERRYRAEITPSLRNHPRPEPRIESRPRSRRRSRFRRR